MRSKQPVCFQKSATHPLFFASLSIALLGSGALEGMAQERALGLDISAWQGNISQTTWNNFRNVENRQFVVLRSSRGGTTGYYNQNDADNSDGLNTLSQRYDDPYFVQNVNRAVAAGMFVGSYHFSRPDIIETTLNSGGIRNSGADEADHFIQMAGAFMRPGYLPPVHDLEAGINQRTADELAQFAIDFSNRVYERMGIRPAVYTGGNYANYLQSAALSLRNQLVAGYPVLWTARWPNQSNPNAIDVQNGHPKDSYTPIYGPWDDAGVTHPWTFWQYASTLRLQSFNNGGSNLDADVAQGGVEFLKDLLIPAIWMNDSSGLWTTLTNCNSGQTPVAPVTGPGQVAPVGTQTLPTPRLPGTNDTVILERPNANITVTLSSGTRNIRKLYVRETLNITGGALNLNYVPSWDSTTNAAQFSGPVTLSGSGSLSLHTLQVDNNQTFTVGSGSLAFNTINLMPHGTSPAQIAMTGNVNIDSFSGGAAIITNGNGSGASGFIDLSGAPRAFNVSANVDLFVSVPLVNGGIIKNGLGTICLDKVNSYAGGTIVSAGTLLVNNSSGSGTGSGGVTVDNGGILGGVGSISGVVTVNAGGILSPGKTASFGVLTLGSAPVLNGATIMAIDRNGGSPLADKLVLSSGTLNYGGTLVVSNAGAAFTGGEIFSLFTAPNFSGAFATINLPALNPGLNWDLSNLTVNGTIKVNRSPVANLLSYSNAHPAILQIPMADLIANATDADSDPLSLASLNLTTTNGVTLVTNSTHIFYSNAENVSDRFFYTISDGRGGSATGIVDIVSLAGIEAPVIATHPSHRTNAIGTTVFFTVSATGTSPTYQWRKDNVVFGNGGKVSGAASSTLTLSNVSPSDAADYSVIVSNLAGSVTSSPAMLVITDPPVITAQPQNTNVFAGQNASFAVSVTGGAPFFFQWRFEGNPLASNMNSSLTLTDVSTNQAGTYDVIITNAFGTITSQVATLTVNPPPPPSRLERLWQLAPYSRPYLTTNDLPFERGMTYNPATHHVLVASRSNHIYVLDAETGSHLHEMNMTGVTGGLNATYYILLISAAEDGAIYGANLKASSAPFKIYRWANDDSNTVPTVIFSGDPVPGTGQRWGDSFDVRGSGTNTQILIGPRYGTNVVIFTTTNGLDFTPRNISLLDTPNGHVALGLAFGAGNTFWGTTHTNSLREVSFDLEAGTAVTTRLYNNAQIPTAICPIGISPSLNMLAGVHVFSPNHLRVYDLTLTNGTPVLIGSTNFATDNSNTHTGAGAVDFGSNTVYALDANNGLMAVRIAPLPILPSIVEHPLSLAVSNGAIANFYVTATGTAPLSYQWRFNDSPLAGATDSSWSKTGVNLGHTGNYTVVVNNSAGSVTSQVATLTVTLPLTFEQIALQSDQQISLSGSATPGNYVVEATSTPFTNWMQLTNVVVGTNGIFEFVDGMTNAGQRFYRVKAQP